MTMEWNNRDYRFDSDGGDGNGSFQEHDRHMRDFHKSHASVAMVNGLRRDTVALLESMEPLRLSCTMMETGGARLLNGTMDWSALIPLLKVARYKLSQN